MTQNNLGNALATLGERESGTARLEEAVAAYRAALEEMDARAGSARLGDDAEQSRQCALNARRAGERDGAARGGGRGLSRGAGGEDARAGSARLGDDCRHGLANALATLAKRQKNAALLEEALASMRGAVDAYQQAGEGYWLPIAQRRVAEMEAELAEMQAQTNCNG